MDLVDDLIRQEGAKLKHNQYVKEVFNTTRKNTSS